MAILKITNKPNVFFSRLQTACSYPTFWSWTTVGSAKPATGPTSKLSAPMCWSWTWPTISSMTGERWVCLSTSETPSDRKLLAAILPYVRRYLPVAFLWTYQLGHPTYGKLSQNVTGYIPKSKSLNMATLYERFWKDLEFPQQQD